MRNMLRFKLISDMLVSEYLSKQLHVDSKTYAARK